MDIKRYIRFYASAVSLAAHGSGGLQLSCGTYKAGLYATFNRRDRLTDFGPVRATSYVKQHNLAVSLSSSH